MAERKPEPHTQPGARNMNKHLVLILLFGCCAAEKDCVQQQKDNVEKLRQECMESGGSWSFTASSTGYVERYQCYPKGIIIRQDNVDDK